jgi:hypothetical protein
MKITEFATATDINDNQLGKNKSQGEVVDSGIISNFM